jgi:predicted metal-binding membrane protein
MGLHHGAHCLGCCWALMLVLFAVGIMNLWWVAAIGVFVLLEKTDRAGVMLSRAGGVALIAIGAFRVFTVR